MRILTVSVAPLYPNRVMGGSQRILMEAVDALVEAGHAVRVFAPEHGTEAFETVSGASVEPVLELRGAFPAPYQTAPHRLASTWRVLAAGAEWADRAYLHADAIYMRAALGDIPVIRSLHDFVYEEALLSAFTLPASRTIVPSQYMKSCIEATAGSVVDVGELVVVPNGVSAPARPVSPVLPDSIEPRTDGDIILAHPHRLHPEKGVEQSMRIAALVQTRMPGRRVRLLTPALQDDGGGDHAVLADSSVHEMARSAGAAEIVELHGWLSTDSMPGYLAAADVTLCPGSFVEAFGLVPLESVVAGTPAVCSRVGAFREQAGLPGIAHFDYGDIEAAADEVIRALSNPFDGESASQAVTERYNVEAMRRSYVKAITGPLAQRASTGSAPETDQTDATGDTKRWSLAPWCYISGERIYHDYLAGFEPLPSLAALFAPSDVTDVAEDSLVQRVDPSELELARKHGFIVPAG